MGQPTTNLVGDGMSIYNNVPGDVTATLATTGEFYRGAAIYKLTLTPTTASGVSYLTAGNNPGIGVVSGGGGGLANRYTGHSIFFRPTVPMHSSPIYTHYSNIAGWQSSTNYYSMNDGWLRAHVIWYDTVTRSDGKYWAINPASATLNVPIIIYWAGPFKEDRNDSVFVSPYTTGTRNNTNNLIDLTNRNSIVTQSLTYNSDGTFTFIPGNFNYIDSTSSVFTGTGSWTMGAWFKINGAPTNSSWQNVIVDTDATGGSANMIAVDWGGYHGGSQNQLVYATRPSTGGSYTNLLGPVLTQGVYYHVMVVRNSSFNTKLYVNGVLNNTYNGNMPTAAQSLIRIGRWTDGTNYANATIPSVQIYDRALLDTEVLQNFNAQRGLYGI